MYRILIVDDEEFVVDWISDLLETQSKLELDICRAYSANAALDWLNRAKVDIVISDIRMPKMSGIVLSEKIKLNWPQCKVILLTAYAEFDYAYEAIKNNVVGYLLKDEDDERILDEINKAAALLDAELNNSRMLDNMQEHLKEYMTPIQQEILLNILKGEYANIEEPIDELINTGLNLKINGPFMLMACIIENMPEKSSLTERLQLICSVEKIAMHYTENQVSCFPVEYKYNRLCWIMQPCTPDDKVIKSKNIVEIDGHTLVFTKEILEIVQKSCMETLGLRISFALYKSQIEAKNLSQSFRSTDRVLTMHMTDETGFIITSTGNMNFDENQNVELECQNVSINTNLYLKLKNCLDDNKKFDFMAELEKICEKFEGITSWHNNMALECYFSVTVILISYINRKKLAKKLTFQIGLDSLFRPYEAGSWKNAADYLRRLSDEIFKLQRADNDFLSVNIIRKLKDYIQSNITGDVSLVRLSEVTGYSSFYLSRFFSEKCGITLNNYISRQKLFKIEELLSQNMSISEVAKKAGFESRTYFNNFLNRMTGMSPQEYRAHLQQVHEM